MTKFSWKIPPQLANFIGFTHTYCQNQLLWLCGSKNKIIYSQLPILCSKPVGKAIPFYKILKTQLALASQCFFRDDTKYDISYSGLIELCFSILKQFAHLAKWHLNQQYIITYLHIFGMTSLHSRYGYETMNGSQLVTIALWYVQLFHTLRYLASYFMIISLF